MSNDKEREAYIAWMLTYPETFTQADAEHYWKHEHVSALAWQARASVASQPAAQGWMPIETAPKDETEILVMYMHIDTQIVHNGFWLEGTGVDDEDIGWWSYDHSEVSRIKLDAWMSPIAWMPLPPPFAADGGEQSHE